MKDKEFCELLSKLPDTILTIYDGNCGITDCPFSLKCIGKNKGNKSKFVCNLKELKRMYLGVNQNVENH